MRSLVHRTEPLPLRAAAPVRPALSADRLIAGGVAGLGVASAVMLARAANDWRFAVGFLVGFAAIAAVTVLLARGKSPTAAEGTTPHADRALLRTLLDMTAEPAALTDRAGRL